MVCRVSEWAGLAGAIVAVALPERNNTAGDARPCCYSRSLFDRHGCRFDCLDLRDLHNQFAINEGGVDLIRFGHQRQNHRAEEAAVASLGSDVVFAFFLLFFLSFAFDYEAVVFHLYRDVLLLDTGKVDLNLVFLLTFGEVGPRRPGRRGQIIVEGEIVTKEAVDFSTEVSQRQESPRTDGLGYHDAAI